MASSFQKFYPYGERVNFVCLFTLNTRYREYRVLEDYCYVGHKQPCWEVKAHWSDIDGHVEVERCSRDTRPFDSSKKLSLCRYYWKCERRSSCMYAHSIKELDHWYASCRGKESTGSSVQRSVPFKQVEDYSSIESRKLTIGSYTKKFQALLQLEQKAHKEKLKSICDGMYAIHLVDITNVPHFKSSSNYIAFGYISGMDGDAINYGSRASSGKVDLMMNNTTTKGEILSCNLKNSEDKLYLGFSESHQLKDNHEVSVIFNLNFIYFDRLAKAVLSLKENMITRILPGLGNFVPSERKATRNFHSNLSPQQVAAYEAIISVRKGAPPVLLTGSFGCGKTHILAKSVLTFLNEDNDFGVVRILVGTQQNVSADNFLKLCLQFQIKKDPELFIVRLNPSTYSSSSRHINRKYFRTTDDISSRGLLLRKKVLFITTCSTSFTALRESVFPAKYFTHVFLDECAQMREPEAIAPLCLAHPEAKLAMAGDLQQVGPSTLVIGEEPRKYGLAVSLIERLHKLYKKHEDSTQDYLCELTENHRCHKVIVEFCNEHFYDGAKMTSNIEDRQFPLQFVCSSMELKMDQTDHNRVYDEEANIIVEQLCKVYEYWPKGQWGQEKDCSQIAIAAATRAQLSRVEEILQKYSSDIQHTSRVTTNDIQGKEYRVVIISTSEPTLGNGLPLSLTDSICIPQVFNTVISRARSLVIVVGNPLALLVKEKSILGDKEGFWKSYLRLCLMNGTFQTDYISQKSPHVHSVFMEALRGLLQDHVDEKASHIKDENYFN